MKDPTESLSNPVSLSITIQDEWRELLESEDFQSSPGWRQCKTVLELVSGFLPQLMDTLPGTESLTVRIQGIFPDIVGQASLLRSTTKVVKISFPKECPKLVLEFIDTGKENENA